MKMITLSYLVHRGSDHIALHFEKDFLFTQGLRTLILLRWSLQNSCWYCPYSKENFLLLKKYVLSKGYPVEYNALAEGVKNRLSPAETIAAFPPKLKAVVQNKATPLQYAISEENAEEFKKFLQRLSLKMYSPSTVRTYSNELMQFLKILGKAAAPTVTVERLKDYFQYCHNSLKLSEATLHSRINALKFYYEQVLGRERFFWDIPRPKKPFQLPKVLSEAEIGRLFNAVGNIKHKAMLFAAYSAGLRVSEVVNLKIKDVDSDRMQLFIERAKGKKDRYVNLSILLLDVLRAYLKKTRPLPRVYVFENPNQAGKPYSTRSVQQIFQTAKEKAFINKAVGVHSLRHSFATHLMEKGIDIRYIKDLLGHLSIKTTERYLHVKRDMLVAIPSVLDELNKNVHLDW
ncbi:MAG: tyrosine-type recombinase/integrase [Ferruginibacter sp.]